jgi:hypothetical protein
VQITEGLTERLIPLRQVTALGYGRVGRQWLRLPERKELASSPILPPIPITGGSIHAIGKLCLSCGNIDITPTLFQ